MCRSNTPLTRHQARDFGSAIRRPRMMALGLLAAGLLSACAPASVTRHDPATLPTPALDLPPMKIFDAVPAQSVTRSNTSIARDFLDLSFQLENGVQLPTLTRFEGPITLRVTGDRIPVSLNPDLDRLLTRLRTEAGIEISRVPAAQPASITIEALSKAELARRAPNTACIVVPNVSSWEEFTRARRHSLSWTEVTTRTQLSIFLPSDEAPQEIRDCLHEELAQALGPLNDLFRLSDSVFNDDNIHSVLTPFDMLILRATYDPALRSGMGAPQVAAALPGILDRIHPQGRGSDGRALAMDTPVAWQEAVLTALGEGALNTRRTAAQNAVIISQENGWTDSRAGFSWMLLGRLSVSQDRVASHMALTTSYDIYAARPETRFHAAHVAMQLAALALSEGQYERAYTLSANAIPAAQEAQNAALLASLMLTEAEALVKLGRPSEARSLRLDSLGWARYGFGSDEQVRARVAEIAALAR